MINDISINFHYKSPNLIENELMIKKMNILKYFIINRYNACFIFETFAFQLIKIYPQK